jgi:hypothetical protein
MGRLGSGLRSLVCRRFESRYWKRASPKPQGHPVGPESITALTWYLTQDYLSRLLGKGVIGAADPSKSRVRALL